VPNRTKEYTEAAKVAVQAIHETNGQAAPSEPWAKPLPFGRPGDVPSFPVNVLPRWLSNWVRAEAEATQTPPDLAGCLALAIAGAGLARKARVRVRDGWTEPVNIFATVALLPGDRKTAVFGDALAPVVEYEAQEKERMEPVIAELACEHRILEARLRSLEQKAAKAKDGRDEENVAAAGAQRKEAEELRRQAKELAKELARHHVPDEPRLFCDDVTPEALGRLVCRQGGRMLLAAAEGTAFEIAKGRYSETANFDVFLKGHAGDPLRTDRTNRESEGINNPALSCALAVQPDVISGLAEQASMRGRGFLARWLYSLPVSKVGSRKAAPPAVPDEVAQRYRAGMLALWGLEKNNFAGPDCPWELELSGAADQVIRSLERWLEPQLADGEPLSYLAGWANKLCGACARLSLILHMAAMLGTGGSWNEPIGSDVAEAAVTLGRDYFLPHARAAFACMGADERARDAARVVGWLAAKSETLKVWKGGRVVSRADLHTAVFGGSRSVDDVSAVCRLLCEHGYLRSVGPAYRRDSQLYEVNPYRGGDSENG